MKYLYYNQPERYAQDIHSSLQLEIPVDMNKVCEAFGIKVHNEDLANAEAFLVVSNGNKSILINDRKILYVARQRFSIAHEVGHFFIPWHNISCACNSIGDFDIEDITEREADIFASELLIPTKLLESRLLSKVVTLELIKILAREYNVSLSAMTRKVASLSNDDFITLYSSISGSIQQRVKTESFNLTLKTKIVDGSAARELLNNRYSNASAKRIVSCNTWFEEDRNDIEIVEESLYQPNFNRVFTLLRIANEYDYFDAFFDR
jgi:Zn-dependent peptidase ImmA (M78 family)